MWVYQQGSYQALRLYLEEREGRALDSQEFDDFRYLAAAIRLTIQCLPKLGALVSEVVSDSFNVEELGLPQELMAG